jgi:hypothetical protein
MITQSVINDDVKTTKLVQPQKLGGKYPRVALGMGITAQFMDITPELAEDWLKKNPQVQRKQSKHIVNMISRLILSGEWRINGQTIIFNSDGKLADGQHRLAAIANSGKTCMSLVLYGVPVSAFETMDSGRARSPADALKAAGFNKTTGLASATAMIYKYNNGIPLHGAQIKMSPLEISEMVKDDPQIKNALDSAAPCFQVARSVAVPTLCYYVLWKVNRKQCQEFFKKLATGEDLSKGHPILELRRKLIGRPTTERTNHQILTHWIIKTWNAFRNGEELAQLRIGPNEELPKPV